jgi:hypothetical protein
MRSPGQEGSNSTGLHARHDLVNIPIVTMLIRRSRLPPPPSPHPLYAGFLFPTRDCFSRTCSDSIEEASEPLAAAPPMYSRC